MRAIIFSIISVLLVVPCIAQKKDKGGASVPAPPPPTPYSSVQRENLLNGLDITIRRDSGAPLVKMDLIIRAGAMFDLAGKTGIAKLTQETLLAANPRLVEEFASFNAKISWNVNQNTTQFHIESPAVEFNTAIEMLGRLLVVEKINNDAFKLAYENQVEEVKSNSLTVSQRADEFFFNTLYGAHPYGHNIDGTPATLANIKQNDVYDYLQRFYLANNSAVIVEGNISTTNVLTPFKTYFGGWEKAKIIPATFRPPQPKQDVQVSQLKDTRIPNIEVRAGVQGLKANDPDFFITELLAQVIQLKSQAHNTVVKVYQGFLPSPIMMSFSTPASSQELIVDQISKAFVDASSGKNISDVELTTAKSALIQAYAGRSIFDNLVNMETYKLPRNFPLEIQKRIEGVRIVDLNRVAAKLFNTNALTITLTGNVGGLEPSK